MPVRDRRDRCPGVLRPWPADDGLLLRLRLVGGRLSGDALRGVLAAAEGFGDGRIRLTNRANLQLRGFPASSQPGQEGQPSAAAVDAIRATGLLQHPDHDLVRNIMVSPLTGLDTGVEGGGRADLRGVAQELDHLLVASPSLARLPGKFLFVLDDGSGHLMSHACDLGLVALDAQTVQLRIGDGWGEVLPLGLAAARLAVLAEEFVERVGSQPEAPWHVVEYDGRLFPTVNPDPRLPQASDPLPFGPCPGGEHVEVGQGGIDRRLAEELLSRADEFVVTPWYGIIVPAQPTQN
ncbi:MULTISPECIES: nitrite reductase [unclassified Luteococcus]|uniref:nitrite reductase n=1 Tax=unclassified Luteococcus TaxID=2639923 RepID=UPI00313E748B